MKREKPQCCAAYWERAFFYVSCDSSTLRSHVHGLELDCYPLLKSLHNTLKTLSRKSLPLIREGGPPIYDRMLPVMRGLTDVYFLISLDKLCLPLHIHRPLNPTTETLKPHLYLQTAVPEKCPHSDVVIFTKISCQKEGRWLDPWQLQFVCQSILEQYPEPWITPGVFIWEWKMLTVESM